MEREEVGFARWCWVACEARCQCQLRRMKTWRAGRLAIASCPAVAEASDGYAIHSCARPPFWAEWQCVHRALRRASIGCHAAYNAHVSPHMPEPHL